MNVSMRNIRFSFSENIVLDRVNFEVKSGEIRALLGENGAGKSTLMNLLGGIHPVLDGEILLDGKPVKFNSPAASIESGIAFIHQELNLIKDLTVYENMFLSNMPCKGVFLDKKLMIEKTSKLFNSLNIDISPLCMVRDLDVSYQQIVEISRALLQNAKVIIMDEPTTSLANEEIERIFEMMRTLKNKGVSIIYISHKLGEVMEICDTYTVLRNSEVVAEGLIKDTSVRELSEHLVGHSLASIDSNFDSKIGEKVLELDSFGDGEHFNDINLSVSAGEILGVTGLLGDGRSELFQAVFGSKTSNSLNGKMMFEGREIKLKNTAEASKIGIAYLSGNRIIGGILGDMSILDNASIVKLNSYTKGIFLDNDRRRNEFLEDKSALNIKMESEKDKITVLSGGNQQKVLLEKWLVTTPKLFILDNPTQGVDIGAKEEIYDIICECAKNGAAIIVLSPEAKEILRLCKRAVVMYHGHIAAELSDDNLTEHNIMYYSTGGTTSSCGKKREEGEE